LLLGSAVIASIQFRRTDHSTLRQPGDSIKEKLKQQYPIADSNETPPNDPKERAKRIKRSKKYNAKSPVIGPDLVQTSEGYNWPADFKPIPTSASNLIIVATTDTAAAHLSDDKNSVYSEFAVKIDQVLKNETSLPIICGESLTVVRKGGRVRYPSGHVSWFFVAGQGLPQLNTQYILFLKTTDEAKVFDIVTGYAIVNDRVEPLDYSPRVVGFQRYSGTSVTAFLSEVRNSILNAQLDFSRLSRSTTQRSVRECVSLSC